MHHRLCLPGTLHLSSCRQADGDGCWERGGGSGVGREASRGTGQAGARDSATGACRRLYLGAGVGGEGGGENREICQWGSSWEQGSPHCVIHAGRPLSSLVLGLSFAALQERRLESRKRCLLTCSASLGRGAGIPASSVLCAAWCSWGKGTTLATGSCSSFLSVRLFPGLFVPLCG